MRRARREDVSRDLTFVRVRGTKRKTRDRVVPVVTADQRSLLSYSLQHAQGEEGLLFHHAARRAARTPGLNHRPADDAP